MNRITRKWILNVLSVISLSALSLALSVLYSATTSTTANAVSDYDDVVRISTQISVKNESGTYQEANYNYDWTTVLVNNDSLYNSAGVGATQRDSMQAYFNDNKLEWGISQFQDPSTGQKNLFIWWADELHEQALWETPLTDFRRLRLKFPAGTGYTSWINVTQDSSGNTTINGYGHQTGTAYLQIADNQTAGDHMVFASTFAPIQTPTGYEGLLPPTSLVNQETERPDVKVCTNFRTITIQNKSEYTTDSDVNIRFMVTQGTFETGIETFEGMIPYNQSTSFNVTNDQPFNVQVFYVDSENNLLEDTSEIDFRETVIPFSGTGNACQDTTAPETECNENDECTTPIKDKYPDCTEHNWTMTAFEVEITVPSPATIGCAIGVFWGQTWDFLIGTWNEPIQDPFGTFNTDTHGLTSIITAPLYIFTNMTTNEYTCSPMVLPMPNIGNLTLPCMNTFYEETIGGTFLTLYQTIVSGIISYFVLVGMLKTMKESKDLQNDKIEVTDL